MRIGIFGQGAFGSAIQKYVQSEEIVYLDSRQGTPSLSLLDVCIDVSHPHWVLHHAQLCTEAHLPLVVGTTGWNIEPVHQWIKEHQGTLLYSPNFSLGMALFTQLMEHAFSLFSADYDTHGVEHHHAHKKDSPSGTARLLQSIAPYPFDFTSVRFGHHPGKHTLFFESSYDRITCTHEAFSKEGFCIGILKATHWIIGKTGWFTFHDMVRSLYSAHYAMPREYSRS